MTSPQTRLSKLQALLSSVDSSRILYRNQVCEELPFGAVIAALCSRNCYRSRSFQPECGTVQAAAKHSDVGAAKTRENSQSHSSSGTLGSFNTHIKLVRDFIHDSLYNSKYGYFSTKADVVGIIPEAINFRELRGRRDYRQLLGQLYYTSDVSWLTPVEVFKPWYGYALGEYILRMHNPALPLKIYEIGGGSGTCALNVMDYIKQNASPQVYRNMKYTSVEISASLAERQLSRVRASGGHGPKFTVQQQSAAEQSAWGERNEEHCFVIMLEVLDNLPHDRVERQNPSSPWQETWVQDPPATSPPGQEQVAATEVLRTLQDPLLLRCMTAMGMLAPGEQSGHSEPISTAGRTGASSSGPLAWVQRLLGGRQVAWVPTGLMALLETLHRARPNMTLVVADFSSLPDVKLAGDRAPLVASKKDGVTVDHATYLVPKGSADIFFPTDFAVLQKLDHWCAENVQVTEPDFEGAPKRSSTAEGGDDRGGIRRSKRERVSAVVGTTEFLQRVADTQQTHTSSGFNPLLEDYSNTKFYVSLPAQKVDLR